MTPRRPPLTAEKRARIQRYAATRAGGATAREAAIAAGYAASRAQKTAEELEQLPETQSALAEERARLVEQARAQASVSVERLQQELEHVALSDIRQLFRWTETGLALKPMHEWPEGAARAVAGVKVRTLMDGSVLSEFKLWPKLDAVKQLAQLMGYLQDEDGGKVPASITVNVVRE